MIWRNKKVVVVFHFRDTHFGVDVTQFSDKKMEIDDFLYVKYSV